MAKNCTSSSVTAILSLFFVLFFVLSALASEDDEQVRRWKRSVNFSPSWGKRGGDAIEAFIPVNMDTEMCKQQHSKRIEALTKMIKVIYLILWLLK